MKNTKFLTKIFAWFESRVEPYPEATPITPSKGLFLLYLEQFGRGARVDICAGDFDRRHRHYGSAAVSIHGQTCGLAWKFTPETLFAEKGWALFGMVAMMVFAVLWHFVASNVRLQTLQGVFPMRLRWNFHRLMLNQSLGFYQDEFAGRVSAKVMQTALAVRDVVMTIADMVIYIFVYFFDFRTDSGGNGWLVACAVCLVDSVVRADDEAVDAEAWQNGAGTSGCAQPDDGAHYRCLFQYCYRKTLFARRTRSPLRQAVYGRIYGNCVRPNAACHAVAHLEFHY